MKFIKKLLKRQPEVVEITGDEDARIIGEIARIEGIDNWLELHRQAGYQLFGRTREERYLGYVNFTESLDTEITKSRTPEVKEEAEGGGYESSVEQYN